MPTLSQTEIQTNEKIKILADVIIAEQIRAVEKFMTKLLKIDKRLNVAEEPHEFKLLKCCNTGGFDECYSQYRDDLNTLASTFQLEADTSQALLHDELNQLTHRMNTIYDELGGDIYAKVEVKALAEEAIAKNQRKVMEKLQIYEDSVVCDINGLQDILTEEQFQKMEIIFQISMNTALVQAGFSYIHVSYVVIEEECLVENNTCIDPTYTIDATDTINATDAGRMLTLARTRSNQAKRTLRILQRVKSGRCGAYCSQRPLRSDVVSRGRGHRQLQAKASKDTKAPKSAKASKDSKAAPEQFTQPKYNSFFEQTVSEEYANNLRTQEHLLADKPSEVNTYCRLLKDFLQE